jgi:hypothetical protein
MCSHFLLDSGIGRARPLLESSSEMVRVPCLAFVSSRARGRRLGQRFRFGGAGASYGDSSARADRNRWPRGGYPACARSEFWLGNFGLAGWCSLSVGVWQPMARRIRCAVSMRLAWRDRRSAWATAAITGKQGDCRPAALAYALPIKSPTPKERLRVSNWNVQRLLSPCEGNVLGLPTAR